VLVTSAANVYTSGQLLNLMFIVVLGALIVTNEYFHQTATATFLTTPHRTRVIVSKLAAALLMAAGFWAATTAINVAVGAITFASNGHGVPFGHWTIIRAVLMNLLAYVIWAILGVGLGVLHPQPARRDHHRRRHVLDQLAGRGRAVRHHPGVRDQETTGSGT
jgi:ABC-type transport system involved in multi-copper enzyme maturation permease subunit